MVRSVVLLLALGVGAASAGELEDCYNSESEERLELTGSQPELLRVTDADLAALLVRVRESEARRLALKEQARKGELLANLPGD